MPRTRDLIEVELITSEREVLEVVCQEGGWKWSTVYQTHRLHPAFPHAPTSRAAVLNFIEFYKAEHPRRNIRRVKAGRKRHRVTAEPDPRGEVIHELRERGIAYKEISTTLNLPLTSVTSIYYQWKLRTGRRRTRLGAQYASVRGIKRKFLLSFGKRREKKRVNEGT